jgi:putative transposase
MHAYVLMTNHVHLLLTPDDPEGISRVMQFIGRRYVQFINKTYHRSGTLW